MFFEERDDMLAEIDRLRAENSRLKADLADFRHGATHEAEEVDRLRAENERIEANHVTRAEEIQRRHDAVTPLVEERDRLRAVAEAARELMPFMPGPQAPHIPLANLRQALAALDKETQ